ncbi:HAMP domain-containing sensor histidine kinase [Clostridium sp. HMP27]|uniref:sensor histidine kinase n=1 Tax=Clostridium sp. HMP27 TaxID=1487921 RepID=UPI00052E4587|nr:HAMP domain-containing sensor histidine kinase [Clostridium sp. HMP27]KGK90804.1 integral membrane sensor signal transduction histidine kinase [Clostridium sp. HMP27]
MFKELKHKFVIINMSLLSFVFVAIFTVIYILTAVSGERQINFTLRRIMDEPPKPFKGEPRMATSLVVDLDSSGSIIKSFSFVTMEENTIKELVSKAMESNKMSAKIKSGDFNYSFLKGEGPFGKKVVFVDRSPQQESLKNILIIFTIAGGASLILLYLISVHLANSTIKPIKEAFEKQQQFIQDASHELKTPLTIIKTNLSVISANEDMDVKSQGKWLGFIHSQTERMSNLINDMLSLAKIDSLEQPSYIEKFDFSKVLDGVLLSFEAFIFESDIELKTKVKEDIYLNGNKEDIQRLVTILMDNAVKNTPKDGSISVYLNYEKNSIQLVIRNIGSGIPAESIDKIFERFYRVDPSRARESGGYGLGLAIAKSIVEKHHGKIYVRSNVNVDTSFIVELPN